MSRQFRPSRVENGNLVISEKVFTAQVIKAARVYGWHSAHFRPGKTQRGRWVTAVSGDGAGFPDLVLAKRGWLIFAELKTDKGKLEPRQLIWQEVLVSIGFRCSPMVRYCLWRPKDYDEIIKILSSV